jgi:peptide/nickel transport system permease protein
MVREKRLGTVGGIIVIALLFTGIFAEFLAPYGMNESNRGAALSAPSAEFLLGTDNLGRDLLSRIIFGARVSILIGLGATALSTVFSLTIGIVTAYYGGLLDLLVQRIVDAWMALPGLVILMVIISVVGPGIMTVIVVLGLHFGIIDSRIYRGAALSVKEDMFVEAAQAIGCSVPRVLIKHILPNILPTAIILFTIDVPDIILIEAGLSFLGFGIPPPQPSWGSMLSGSGRSYMFLAPWMAIWPGVAIAVTVYGISMFGDALRDILDPRLRGAVGHHG